MFKVAEKLKKCRSSTFMWKKDKFGDKLMLDVLNA